MTDKAAWQGQVGNAWAAQWARTDRSFAGLTDRLLGRASEHRFERALDVGCGAGELAMALGRGHPHAQVVGVDVSEELVTVARQRGAQLANVTFECSDAAHWPRTGYRPDLLVSRHGVMFFDDPIGAFTHLHELADHEARLVFSCFRSLADNPWAAETTALLPPGTNTPSSPDAPGPFAFADPSRVENILDRAGWCGIGFEAIEFAYVVGCGDDPVDDAMGYLAVIGPVARSAAALGGEDKAAFLARLRRYLERHASGSIVALKAAAWIVTARR